MRDLAVAFGLFLVLEGLVYAGFPGAIKRIARELPGIPDNLLRNFGVIAMMIGVAIVWYFKSRG
jgi:uncharacterized protein YjeT (DUF2065 family)